MDGWIPWVCPEEQLEASGPRPQTEACLLPELLSPSSSCSKIPPFYTCSKFSAVLGSVVDSQMDSL